MSITRRILGSPGRDNALLATVDTGQSLHRLLFDCGEGCLSDLSVSDIQSIEAVFFSHFHVDHVAGFDTFLRLNWSRPENPVRIYGPPGAIRIVHHRLQGYTWNLVAGSPGEWLVTEVDGSRLRTSKFLSREGFSTDHSVADVPRNGALIYEGNREFAVRSHTLDHGTPCLAFRVDEPPRVNIDAEALRQLGLPSGPWLQELKDPAVTNDSTLRIDGAERKVSDLRTHLLSTSKGDSIAYLTDFYLSSSGEQSRLAEFLEGCETLVCENNYCTADVALAKKNFHMTSADVAELAQLVDPRTLVLFHLSDRYRPREWHAQLEEVRSRFPNAAFPKEWDIPEDAARDNR